MAQEASSIIGFVQNPITTTTSGDGSNPPPAKKKRNLPGTPDPEAEVIALSPKALMATNKFLCEICGKGFQRDQNLQLHRRGHNLPWKLKQRSSKEPKKKVYICPEKTCVHSDPSRALGDLTGIKKHFFRKHGEKNWKCDKCSKRYAVQSDWKAHSKTCGTREYRCDCGTLFSRRDSFITHRAFCDALAEETARLNAASNMNSTTNFNSHFMGTPHSLRPNLSSQHFVFKSISSNNDETSEISQISTCGFPLWMAGTNQIAKGHESMAKNNNNNNLQEMHTLGCVSSSPTTLIFGDPSLNSDDYQLNWVFGKKMASARSAEEVTSSTSLPLCNVNNKEEAVGSSQELLVSIPCLYSNQQTNNAHQTLSANMSATALLQKAAQIGVTTTSADSSFFGSLGGVCNNNQVQEGNKFCSFYSSNPIISTSQRNYVEGDYLLNMYSPAAKTRQVQSDQEGQTRDFLGVGVQTICHPSSINGWI